MGKCLKGKSETDADKALFKCKKCGAMTEDKTHVCSPSELQSPKAEEVDAEKPSKGEKKIRKALEKLEKAKAKLLKAEDKLKKARDKAEKKSK